jgi:aspartate aminotransferase
MSQITPSATEKTSALANRMRREGIDVISFAQGEPDFDTPENIREAGCGAIRGGFTRYTDVPGIPELKDAIAEKFRRENGLSYDRDEIIASNGGKQILYLLFRCVCNPGDEVILPTPCYVSYADQIRLSGGVPVFAPTSEARAFRLCANDIRPHLSARTKVVVVNSPNNPTGAICTGEDLREIAALSEERDLLVVTDEVYEHLLYDGVRHVSFASLDSGAKRRTITVNSLSKTYAMTGWRIGFAGGPAPLIGAMSKLQGHVSGNVNSVTQKAAIEALRGPQDAVEVMRTRYESRRNLMMELVDAIPGLRAVTPQGAFYLFTDVRGLYGRSWKGGVLGNDIDVAEFLLAEAHVAVVPGEAFAYGGFVRFVFAKGESVIREGLGRVARVIGALR